MGLGIPDAHGEPELPAPVLLGVSLLVCDTRRRRGTCVRTAMVAFPPAPATRRAALRHYARSRAWCEWDDFDAWTQRAGQDLSDSGLPATPPFHLLSLPGISAAQQNDCATRWMAGRLADTAGRRQALSAEFARARTGRPASQRLRLGYLSCDFHQHATALLMVEMLEAHDAACFELHAFSHGGADDSAMRHRLRARFDGFHDISALDDEAAACAIAAQGIDLLIDLKGYTAGSRSLLLAYGAAPVTVSYLGYPGTLGGGAAPLCQYLISDAFVTPPGSQADYAEALALLPHSYQPHGRLAPRTAVPRRSEAGLPAEGRVLCCFNQAWKFTPEVFDLWCGLLRQHPDTVLWLLASEVAEGNLRREAMARGVAPHRLVFAPDAGQDEHLARLQLADLVLDTLPYNAHTTASDALWAGVPVLTCAGSTFAARVAGSLLHAVGLPELVTHDLASYAALADALLADPARLQALRRRLADGHASAALWDVAGYTRALEALYSAMWQRHQAGLGPQPLGGQALAGTGA